MNNTKSPIIDDLAPISRHALANVVGGMQWEQFRRSTNVEDARGMSPQQSAQAFPQGGGNRGPDLSQSKLAVDAGINSIGTR